MKSKQLLFFATAKDIEPIINSVETTFSIKYYETGLFDSNEGKLYHSAFEIPHLGFPKANDWINDIDVMAIDKNEVLKIREVPQRKGGLKYAIDPLENQNSICFQFGGTYQEGILIAGKCGTSFLNDFSQQIFKTFSSNIKKQFKKIGAFYVGKEAEQKLKEGWRLVTNEKSPKEYDLVFD